MNINTNLNLSIIKNLINYLQTNNITYKNNNNKFIIIPNTSPQLDYLLTNYNESMNCFQKYKSYTNSNNIPTFCR